MHYSIIKEGENVLGYKIKINSLPEVIWALETDLTNYEWQNSADKNSIEISLSRSDKRYYKGRKSEVVLKGCSLECVVGDEEIYSCCEDGQKIAILSVSFRFSEIAYERLELNAASLEDKNTLLLPMYIQNLSIDEETDLNSMLHSIIKHYHEKSESGRLKSVSVFLKLLAKIDGITKKNLIGNKNKRENYYTEKINNIIEKRYGEKLKEKDIAKELGISPVYLAANYKKETGCSFSRKLLMVRMKKAADLLGEKGMSTAEVAMKTGFQDEGYFRKKFNAYYGMSVSEYKYIKSGLTLYHDKPERKNKK